ncbi:hypothetical protein BLAT2472_100124 [Burkholderia latens]
MAGLGAFALVGTVAGSKIREPNADRHTNGTSAHQATKRRPVNDLRWGYFSIPDGPSSRRAAESLGWPGRVRERLDCSKAGDAPGESIVVT